MNKYIATLSNKSCDRPAAELAVRHVDHLKKIYSEGKLFLCGQMKETGGALQIILADTKQAAEETVKADPFISEGFFTQYSISELFEANEANNYLL